MAIFRVVFLLLKSARNHILHVSGSTFSAANYPGVLLCLAYWQKGWSDMKKDLFALKGTICYSKNQKELVFHENSYVVCENSLCAGNFFPASGRI